MNHNKKRYGRRIWFWGLSISLVLHLGLAAFLLTRPVSSPPSEIGTGVRAPSTAAPTLAEARSPGRVRTLVDEAVRQARRLDHVDKMDKLRRQAKKVEKIAAGSVDRMASLVESAIGVDDQSAPGPDPQVPGRFEPGEATVYDITRKADNGRIRYEWIYVDNAGRQLTTTMNADAMTAQDLRLFEIFEMGRSNPALRRLIDVARKVAAKGDRESQED